MAVIEVKVPDIGDFAEVAVIEVLVKAGDKVALEQSLITVESDKASMEIPSSAAGVVKDVLVKVGDKVSEGSLVLMLEVQGAAGDAVAATGTSATQPVASAPAAASQISASTLPPAAAGQVDVLVPDIGDFKDVAVIEVFVKPGDQVAIEQSLITVESDKASMEIPSSHAGVIKELKVKVGDKVNQGDLLAVLSTATGAPAASPVAAAAPVQSVTASSPAVATTQTVVGSATTASTAEAAHQPTQASLVGLPHASPSVRKFARELGVPLAEVSGTGRKGRITEADVQAFTRSVMDGSVQTKAQAAKAPAAGGSGSDLGLLPWPKVDFAKFGPIERKDLSRIKKISGANLHRNWVMIPHVTSYEDADITDLEALRVRLNKENEKSGIKVTMLAFVIKAALAALKKFPEFNASLDGDQLVLKNYWNIGFAADTPNGLVVPVLKNADQKGLLEISAEMAELSKKARDGKLGASDMQGGTFSISSLGGIGTTYFTPLINAPEVAILGLSKNAMKPVWDGKAFVPRLVLPLSLSYDHRVIDGAAGARFNAYMSQALADLRRVLL